MDLLERYRVFVQIAEMGSFAKAAQRLDLPRTSVSAAIQRLEGDLGARLFHRTTRQVHLTTDGEQLLDRLRPLLAEAEEVGQLFQARQRQVSGRLDVDVPSRVARRLIAPALPRFLRRHPKLQLCLGSSDRFIDLVHEGVDCAIRVGSLGDSSLVAQRLGRLVLVNCASPDYLLQHGTPRNPIDLRDGHWAVGYTASAATRGMPWEWQADGEQRSLPLPCRVVVNNAESYIACCLAGVGLIQVPRFDVQDLLASGALVEVMAEYPAGAMDISAVYPHRRQRSQRLTAFVDWFAELIRPHVER